MIEKREPDDNLGLLVHDVARLMRANFHRRVKPLGLTQAQWRALFHLSLNEGIKQGALADILEVQPITMTRLIDCLEIAGWAERRPDPGDRRATQLYTTSKALPLLQQIRVLATQTREEAMKGLSRQARTELVDMLKTTKNNLLQTEIRATKEKDRHLIQGVGSKPKNTKRIRKLV